MSKTVLGIFGSTREAVRIKSHLIAEGYSSEVIKVIANGAGTQLERPGEEGIGEKIKAFFKSFTGAHHEDHIHYTEDVNRGSAWLEITVRDEQADFTGNLLLNLGASNVEEGTATTENLAPAHPTLVADERSA